MKNFRPFWAREPPLFKKRFLVEECSLHRSTRLRRPTITARLAVTPVFTEIYGL